MPKECHEIPKEKISMIKSLKDYKLYAIFYLCFFGVFSLAVCYRVGPPSDIRTLNLIAWLLQLCSLAAIYFLSLVEPRAWCCSHLISSGCVGFEEIPVEASNPCKSDVQQIITFIYGPQQRKLLTEDEYREEARTYTQIELDKLKRHCQSKKSRDALRLISRLHTPNKTSSFIAGDAEHISPQEQSIYSELYGSFEEQNDDMGGYITDDDN
uniref:Transmembrane protein n=1 Tax=Globodera pallida TaxID=36090 RepID=A0A183BP28_GLOPA